MCGFTGAAIVGGVVLAGGVASSAIQSSAAGDAGAAQASAAQQQVKLAQDALQKQIEARASGISQAQAAARMSPEEIAQIKTLLQTRDQALGASLSSLQKQQAQIDAMSPATKAAGENLYNLMTGQSASILAPMQKQLSLQRQNLVSQLSSQMGPGFMTSSAGIQALTTFDNQASMTLNTAQQNAIQTVGAQYSQLQGLGQQGQQAITSGIQSAFTQAQTATGMAQQAYSQETSRETQATLGAMQANPINFMAPAEAQQSVTNTAGAPYAGQMVMGQGIGAASQAAGSAMTFGGMMGAMGGGSTTPGTTPGGGGGPNLGVNTSMPMPKNPGFGAMLAGGNVSSGGGYSGNFGANVATQ